MISQCISQCISQSFLDVLHGTPSSQSSPRIRSSQSGGLKKKRDIPKKAETWWQISDFQNFHKMPWFIDVYGNHQKDSEHVRTY